MSCDYYCGLCGEPVNEGTPHECGPVHLSAACTRERDALRARNARLEEALRGVLAWSRWSDGSCAHCEAAPPCGDLCSLEELRADIRRALDAEEAP